MAIRDLLLTPGLMRLLVIGAGMLSLAALFAAARALRPVRARPAPRCGPAGAYRRVPVATRRRR